MTSDVLIILLLGQFCHQRTLSDGSLNWFLCGMDGSGIFGKMR